MADALGDLELVRIAEIEVVLREDLGRQFLILGAYAEIEEETAVLRGMLNEERP